MTVQDRVEAVLQAAGVEGAVVSLSAVAAIASPMCRAVDWTCVAVLTTSDACFVKLREPDAATFVTSADAAAGGRHAAALGVAPTVRFAQADAMVFDLLQPPWREARLGDVAQSDTLARVLEAKCRMHGGPALLRQWDVFEEIDRFKSVPGLSDLRQPVEAIRAALATNAHEGVPAHADGTVSNVMLDGNGGIRLVDFDCAGMTDPHYDVGVLLNEACADDVGWHGGLEAAFGASTRRNSARCRAFAIADDLLWGLWGLSRHAVSTRRSVEFLKYGEWRLLRCRIALQRHAALVREL